MLQTIEKTLRGVVDAVDKLIAEKQINKTDEPTQDSA
jgi:hypothetical protein